MPGTRRTIGARAEASLVSISVGSTGLPLALVGIEASFDVEPVGRSAFHASG